jgi:hypothetical protein
MSTTNNKNKFFVNPDNRVTIVCPDCGKPSTITVEQFRGKKHVLKVKCTCGHQFKIQLEFRKHQRKSTSITGLYDNSSDKAACRVKITDISTGGARFKTNIPHDLQVGQRGQLVFTLDDKKETAVTREVVIRSIAGENIGCEFQRDQAYDKNMGFYLRH